MKLIYLLFAFLVFSSSQSQPIKPKIPCSERTFQNQGEQEDCWAEEFFDIEYKETNYLNFGGTITERSETLIEFENKVLMHWDTDKPILKIFKKGIFYPQLLIGFNKAIPLKDSDSLSEIQKFFQKLSQPTDTLKISSFEELQSLNDNPRIKKFRFWVYWPAQMNPQVFLIALKNDKATADTLLEDFIDGARLTFIKGAWIIL